MSDDDKFALELAILFHQTYEDLAPLYGYETRQETRQFDSESANGKLMIAVCKRILEMGKIKGSDEC